MSITVPTAEAAGRRSPPPRPPRRWWPWSAPGAVLMVLLLLTGGDDRIQAPTSQPVDRPAGSVDAREVPVRYPQEWSRIVFPGSGVITGVARSDAGAAVVGQHSLPDGASFVWTTEPGSGRWTESPIEMSEQAVVRDVAAHLDGFVVGGAVISPGSGTSVPTLWWGTPGGGFTVVDQPFPGPGRVDAVRAVDGDLVLLGQASGPHADNLRPGSARFGRVLVGRPGEWSDITPEGFSILVTDVVGAGEGMVAVGGNSRGAQIWTRSLRAEGWTAWAPLGTGGGVFTDVLVHPGGGLVAVMRTWDDDGTNRSQIYRATDGLYDWLPQRGVLRRDVGWLTPVAGGVIGGAHDSVQPLASSGRLWGFSFLDGWSPLGVSDVPDTGETSLRVAAEGMVAGSYAGQPALWLEGTVAGHGVAASRADEVWERVGPTFGPSTSIVDDGTRLVAVDASAPALWTSPDGRLWRRVDLPDALVFRGVAAGEDRIAVWGSIGEDSLVLDVADDGNRRVSHVIAGSAVRHVSASGEALVAYAAGPAGSARIELGPEGSDAVESLGELPVRMLEIHGLLVGIEPARPLDPLVVSRDRGRTWTSIGLPVFTLGVADDRLLVVTAESEPRILVLDPSTLVLTPVQVGDVRLGSAASLGTSLSSWAGGLVVAGDSVVHLVTDLTGAVATLTVDPMHGFDGILYDLVPGPRGFVRASEAGEMVLYRWTGEW